MCNFCFLLNCFCKKINEIFEVFYDARRDSIVDNVDDLSGRDAVLDDLSGLDDHAVQEKTNRDRESTERERSK